ncbi:MAG: hypothetical protein AWT59_1182 [Candidatus Gallionella acididurans]|uniref:Uncharacterized protein n=1 Tax=Candidatus Gallionella acididurans TaxID=1796491 RepID=A0A139BUR3_9PROT|nr:MAG: hypothetical protein AWT59_1182 [Candidatus Gallionella acididurans]
MGGHTFSGQDILGDEIEESFGSLQNDWALNAICCLDVDGHEQARQDVFDCIEIQQRKVRFAMLYE